MFYSIQIIEDWLRGTETVVYWQFKNKTDLDRLVAFNHSFRHIVKDDIQKGLPIKIFSHFRTTMSGMFLIPVEK